MDVWPRSVADYRHVDDPGNEAHLALSNDPSRLHAKKNASDTGKFVNGGDRDGCRCEARQGEADYDPLHWQICRPDEQYSNRRHADARKQVDLVGVGLQWSDDPA